jgi:nucleotide-binding universal stress UspA family protein
MAHAYRDIFIPCAPATDGSLSAAVEYALSWGASADMHLGFQLLGQKFDPPYSLASGFVASIAGPANAEEKKRLEATREALDARLRLAGTPYTLGAAQLTHDQTLATAARLARLHDLTVMDDPQSYFTWGRALVEELLFHSGRPVIVVPGDRRIFRGERLLVAWDGTARAARALNDALPLLLTAAHVEVVSVTGEKDLGQLPPGVDCAAHLARHGIKADVVGLDAAGRDAGIAIRERAELAAIDMIVMGAFAHSRWRQLVFGGVTDSMLNHAKTPVFMSA